MTNWPQIPFLALWKIIFPLFYMSLLMTFQMFVFSLVILSNIYVIGLMTTKTSNQYRLSIFCLEYIFMKDNGYFLSSELPGHIRILMYLILGVIYYNEFDPWTATKNLYFNFFTCLNFQTVKWERIFFLSRVKLFPTQ